MVAWYQIAVTMRTSLPASQIIVWPNASYFFLRHFCLSVIVRPFSEGGLNRAAELQMPLANLTDIEIHFNVARVDSATG